MYKITGKRGQLTLFIIIAVVVIAIVILGVVLWPKISSMFMSEEKANQYLASQAEPIRTAVHDCVEKTSMDIFATIGLQGGYYDWSNLYAIDYAGAKVVVMYKDSRGVYVNKLPNAEQIQAEYDKALAAGGYAKIDACLKNFDAFKRYVAIEPGDKKIKALIGYDKITIDVNWPITISKQATGKTVSLEIKQEPVELLISLGNIWKVANDIVGSEVKEIPFEGLVWTQYMTNNYDYVRYIAIDGPIHYPTNDVVIFMFKTMPRRAGEQEYKFYFACDRR